MNAEVWEIILRVGGIVALLTLNAALVAGEFALVRARFSHFNPGLLDRLREKPARARFLDSADRAVQIFRFAQGLCAVGYAAVLFPWMMALAADFLPSGPVAMGIAAVFTVLVATGLFYVIGEAMPRAWGLTHPASLVGVWAWLWPIFRVIVSPFKAPFEALSAGLLRLTGLKDAVSLAHLDWEAQLEMAPDEKDGLSPVAQSILRNAIDLRELVVSDVLLPRRDVQVFDTEISVAENLAMARETGHTRFPLCVGDLDRCIGLIHIKDVFRYRGDVEQVNLRDLRRDILRVEAEAPLEQALTKLLHHKMHMALVLDPFRGVQGVLTLERILEQLVGDIRDEFDADEEVLIRRESGEAANGEDAPGPIEVSGVTPLHEVERALGHEITAEDVSTVSGLVTAELGRIPAQGETVEVEGLTIDVLEADETRVIRAKVAPQQEESEADADETPVRAPEV